MPSKLTVTQAYEILDLQENATWEELRKSYKKKAQQNHPDRFLQNSKDADIAQAKFLKIGSAFRILDEYFKINGEMPSYLLAKQRESMATEDAYQNNYPHSASTSPSGVNATTNRQKNPNHSEKNNEKNENTETDPRTNFSKNTHSAATHTKRKRYKRLNQSSDWVILLIIFLIVAYFLFNPPFSKSHQTQTSNLNHSDVHQVTDINNLSTGGSPKDIKKSNQTQKATQMISFDRLSEVEKIKAINKLSETQRHIVAMDKGLTFTFGSKMQIVLQVHGAPGKMENDVWFYGKSKVYFEKGRVTDWESDPSYPLATSLH